MISEFSTYKTKIKYKEFTNSSGVKFENTVAITFYDGYKKEIYYQEFGFASTEEIYNKIKNSENINIDDCYIENFSLEEFRTNNQIAENEVVKLANFSAINSVFESQFITNFSNAEFISENISFKNALFIKGKLEFKNALLASKKNDFSYCFFNDGNVSFDNATFGETETIFNNSLFKTGNKKFQFCNFNKGKVRFENVNFGDGDVSFVSSNFSEGNVSFKISTFGNGKVDFHYSKFGTGIIDFERINFGDGLVDFRMVEFGEGRCNFNKTIFGSGDVDFEGSELRNGKISFKKTVFGSGKINFVNVVYEKTDLIFDGTIFNSDLSIFSGSVFQNLSFKSCHLDNYFDLRVKKCSNLILSDAIVRDIIDLKPYKQSVNIQNITFSGLRLLGSIYIDWGKNDVNQIIKNQQNATLEEKAEQFLILKENFSKIGQYDSEDKAYIEFKRFEEKVIFHNLATKSIIHKIWGFPAYYFRMLVFDHAGLYATNPVRVLFSMVISYIVFSLIFVIMQLLNLGKFTVDDSNFSFIKKIGESLYFSAITYLTIGYGDISPIGINRFFAALEGFVGVFLMAYFTVAFVRKILR